MKQFMTFEEKLKELEARRELLTTLNSTLLKLEACIKCVQEALAEIRKPWGK